MRRNRGWQAGAVLAFAVAAPTTTVPGPVHPLGPRVVLTEITRLDQPVALAARPQDSDGAVYVSEKRGRVIAVRGTSLSVFVDLRSKVSTENERGLLGVAFSPVDPGHVYVVYSALDYAWTLSEFELRDGRAVATTERVLLRLDHDNDDHYAGSMAFDTNGLLYVSVGDGGGITRGWPGDKFNNAQNLTVLYGKILRIDPRVDGERPYRIPADNPFASGRGKARPEIWAYGLRNPWRISIDQAEKALWVADVGQSKWEEINRVPLEPVGYDFGWRLREGTHTYSGKKAKGAIDPVFEYPHTEGCAVLGGAVVHGGAGLDRLVGTYLFSDMCRGRVIALRQKGSVWKPEDLGARLMYPTSLAEGPGAKLYLLSFNGQVTRIDAA